MPGTHAAITSRTYAQRMEVVGPSAEIRLTETDQTAPAGRYRLQTRSDVLFLERQRNTPWDEPGAFTDTVVLQFTPGAADTDWGTLEFGLSGFAIGLNGPTLTDNALWRLGTDADQVELNRAATLAADTALTSVLLGTTAGSRQALAANSRIVSNVTASGDYGIYVNVAGVSKEALLVDASAETISLGHGFNTAAASAATGSVVVKGGMGVGNGTAAGTAAALWVGHDDSGNAASHAAVNVVVTHASADPMVTLRTAANQYYFGIDNSDNDRLFFGFGVVVGTTPIMSFDLRRTTANVLPVIFNGDTFTIASGATNVIMPWATGNYIVSYTGNTQVTSLQRFHAFSIPTVQADGVGGALTVDKATTVQLSAVTQGANTVLTHSSALRILSGGSGATLSAIYIEDVTGGTSDYGITIAGADTAAIWVQSADPVLLGTAGTATGVLRIAGATSGVVTLTVAATAGTWTMTLPAAVGGAGQQLADLAGNGITGWTDAASRREYKQEIEDFADYHGALRQMLQSPLYTFRYRPGTGHGTGDYKTRYMGVMADESPWALHFDGIINPVNTVGYMVAGFRAVNEIQESQEAKIIRLEARVAELETRLAA